MIQVNQEQEHEHRSEAMTSKRNSGIEKKDVKATKAVAKVELTEKQIVELAAEHEDARYEDEGEAALGRED
jgi:hypothetical protein